MPLNTRPLPSPARLFPPAVAPGLNILFVASAHNSLSQRALVALTALGHRVAVEVVHSEAAIEAAAARHEPELILCPMLRTIIPERVWSRYRCLVVHPGPVGDRGPSSLDWAIELQAPEWGVTVLEANGVVDGGDIWATRTFPMREAGKSSLYRHEVRRAAIEAIVEAVGKVAAGATHGEPLDYADPAVTGRERPVLRQQIDWSRHTTATIIRRVNSHEGHPGVLDDGFRWFGAHREYRLRGAPGEIIAQRDGAICRATVDGAVWISHLKRPGHFKLPATRALELAGKRVTAPETGDGVREITYEESNGVGYLAFDFYNGAMSTGQAQRLLTAYRDARARNTRVLVLMGGQDFFCTGIHLNVIEAADDPAAESWRNLLAIDDLVRAVIETDDRLVVSALVGDAGAGGVPLALAADHVTARADAVLHPYYQHMGGLYGSEYWTYLLPRRVGHELTARLTTAPFEPLGAQRAVELGLIDEVGPAAADAFRADVRRLATALAYDTRYAERVAAKRRARAWDEARKPLAVYRAEELARCHECFFGPDPRHHEARQRFVYKLV
jgi:putative two-component system hydrogenase maturation factor HypX/HoxX